MLPQAEESNVSMVNVTICGISTTVPKVYYDWVTHLAHCSYCYKYNRSTNTYNGTCNVENELHRRLDELNNSRSEHVT